MSRFLKGEFYWNLLGDAESEENCEEIYTKL